MPNLINTDNAGNVFYNYITPVLKGLGNSWGYIHNDTYINFFTEATSRVGGAFYYSSSNYSLRLPPTSLEFKTGSIASHTTGNTRFYFGNYGRPLNLQINSHTTTNSFTSVSVNNGNWTSTIGNKLFMIWSANAFVQAMFSDDLTSCQFFRYAGYLREPAFDDSSLSSLGFVGILGKPGTIIASRPAVIGGSTAAALSTAADAITSPPIVCTAGTDPGDGSETFTDIVIRDAASPNNPVGKLWNCIDMPATCNVGELWRNTGAYDGDASASEQDIYLCVMPWGTRKLGMRVWTENIT